MTEVRFYHLQRTSLEAALPKLLERTLARSQRAVVMAGSSERVEALTAHLWTYDPNSFLPHGSKRDGHADRQPIWLTDQDENPNGASVLFLTDGAQSDAISGFELCVEMLDGQNDAAVAAGRQRWATYKEAGHSLVYFQQDENGRWQEKARG